MVVVALIAVVLAVATAVRQPPPSGRPAAASVADLSDLPPHDRFLRLADRVQAAVQDGDSATVVGQFPLVEAAFAALGVEERDIDARFHLSLLRAEVGHFPGAAAQLDTIVALVPEHLLADYLRALIADFRGDTAAGRAARIAFRSHYDAELATGRPEYLAHRDLLAAFLATTPAN